MRTTATSGGRLLYTMVDAKEARQTSIHLRTLSDTCRWRYGEAMEQIQRTFEEVETAEGINTGYIAFVSSDRLLSSEHGS